MNTKVKKPLSFFFLIVSLFLNFDGATQSFVDLQNKKTIEYLNSMPSNKNIILSPLSIRMAMYIYFYNDKCREQLDFSLGTSESIFKEEFKTLEKDSSLVFANAFYYKQNFPIDASYLSLLKDSLNVSVFEFSEQNLTLINDRLASWAKGKSNGLKLQPRKVDKNTKRGILNLSYFFSEWENPFDKERTKKSIFHSMLQTKSDVLLMNKKYRYPYFEDKKIQAIKIPYKGDLYSMLVILPKEKEILLDVTYYNNIINNLDLKYVDLYLPKFQIESELSLNELLNEKKYLEREDILSNELYHKSFIEVDEMITEVGSLTEITLVTGIGKIKSIEFKACHPFLFYIVKNSSNLIIFSGKFSGNDSL